MDNGLREKNGTCGDMVKYFDECKDHIHKTAHDALEEVLEQILDDGEVEKNDGTAYDDIRALECKLRAEFNFQVDDGSWQLLGLIDSSPEAIDICAAEFGDVIIPMQCLDKEADKMAMIDEARDKAAMAGEFLEFLADASKPYLDDNVEGEVLCVDRKEKEKHQKGFQYEKGYQYEKGFQGEHKKGFQGEGKGGQTLAQRNRRPQGPRGPAQEDDQE